MIINHIKSSGIFWLTLFLILGLIVSCKRMEVVSNFEETAVRDSLIYTEWTNLVEVPVLGESMLVEIEVPANCDSCIGNIKLNQKNKRSGIKVSSQLSTNSSKGKIVVESSCEDYIALVQAKNSQIKKLKEDKEIRIETKIVKEKYIPFIYKLSMITTIALLLFQLIKWLVRKLKLKLTWPF